MLLLFFYLFAQGQENVQLDSLLELTSKYSGPKLVNVFIEIAKLQGVNNSEQAHQSANEAIRLAKQINYEKGIGLAYLAKGTICNFSNSPILGVENFTLAKNVFTQIEDRLNLANASLGLAESYAQQGLMDKAKESYDDAIAYFEYVGDFRSLAKAYYKAATTYNMVDDFHNALENYNKAAINYKAINDKYELNVTKNSIGIIYYYLGNYKEAFQAWSESELAMRELGEWRKVGNALTNKGLIYTHWAAYDEALAVFSESLEIAERVGNNSSIANIYNSMGNAFLYAGNLTKSVEYYRKSVALGEKLDSKTTVSVALHNIGELHLNNGNLDSALYYVQKSLQIENTLFNKLGIAETKATLGKIYIGLHKQRLAFSFFEQAEAAFLEIGNINGLADIYQKYGQAYAEIGNDSLTIYYFNKSNEIAEEIDLKKMQYENHQALADFYEKGHNFEKALYHQKLYHQINDSVFNQIAIDKTAYLSIKLEKEAQGKQLVELQHAQDVVNFQNRFKDYVIYFVSLIFIILAISFYLRYSSNKKSTMRLNDQYQMVLESEEKIKALIDASHDIVLLVDRQGLIVSANSTAETTLRKGSQLVGYNFKEIVAPFFQNQFDSHIAWVLSHKTSRTFSLISSTKRTFGITISPIFKQGIDVSGLAVYIEDVTDILASREEKKKLEDQLYQVQKLESVGTMAGGVAHDFNNYLGTILGYSSMGLDDAEEGSNTKRYFSQIRTASKAAQHTVQKILTFSRKDENKKVARVNLVEVAKDAISMTESTKPIDVNFETIYSSESVEILGDTIEMQQVFINLINNAFHALEGTKDGHIVCQISEGYFSEEHKNKLGNFSAKDIAGIRIVDNGVGMSEQVLKRVFEPFFTTKDVGRGTGLGLSVVHGIIKNNKGELIVESTLGKGSSFYIYLPAIS